MAQPGEFDQDWTFYPIHTLPRPLDVVWCHFPEWAKSGPGPKPRPALVRSIYLNDGHTRALVEVTYGTTKLKTATRTHDLIITNAADMAAIGLPSATRFDLDLTLLVPWAEEFFVPREGCSSPIIGHLNASAIAQLVTLQRFR